MVHLLIMFAGRPYSVHTTTILSCSTFHSNCGTNSTPLWRRSSTGDMNCNACGLYQKAHKFLCPLKKSPRQQGIAEKHVPVADVAIKPANEFFAPFARDFENRQGSCPGGRSCNGAGGSEDCGGCPVFYNLICKPAHQGNPGDNGEYVPGHNAESASTISDKNNLPQKAVIRKPSSANVCNNCGTSITPSWRWDEVGNRVCKACGEHKNSSGLNENEPKSS